MDLTDVSVVDFDEENIPTKEELTKIEKITPVVYSTEPKEPKETSSFWSIFNVFNLFHIENDLTANIQTNSRAGAPFDPMRRIGLSKTVMINNISGKNAWIILSPTRIVSVSSAGLDKVGQLEFERVGAIKCQQFSVPNDSRGEYDLENGLSYVSLFLNIDGVWKRVWIDRLFNTRKYNINILPKHVNSAIEHVFTNN